MSEAYQPLGCRDVLFMYDAIATVLEIPDGQRGVVYYLTEAQAYLSYTSPEYLAALYSLRDAARQSDCTRKQWSLIMRACKAIKVLSND